MQKKGISFIIPLPKRKINVTDFVRGILAALSVSATTPIAFEIIFITDRPDSVVLEDIEVYPHQIATRIHREHEHLTKAELYAKGFSYARYGILTVIEGDVRFPPGSLYAIFNRLEKGTDLVVAVAEKSLKGRKDQRDHFKIVNSKLLLSLQKSLNPRALLFSKKVWLPFKRATFHDKTFVIEFLYKVSESGFRVERYLMPLSQNRLVSRYKRIRKDIAAFRDVCRLKMQDANPIFLPASDMKSVVNAGYGYRKQQYITHSALPYSESAIDSFTLTQKYIFLIAFECIIVGLLCNFFFTLQTVFTILSILYFIDMIFTFYLMQKVLRTSSEIRVSDIELAKLDPDILPVYTILCPLYKEAHMIPGFVKSISALDWPPEKCEVMLLLEADDKESLRQVNRMKLPKFVRPIIIPESQPKTKPKACNYGLALAKGSYIVIYDAEDTPDPLQLKKAYIGFQKSDRRVVCLQAKLSYHNTKQNLLTRFFTAEYSWLFDVFLPGLQSLHTLIPLGGTSNHFRTEDLKMLNGWDPFNVTEDADLGVRIFRHGYTTGIIDSVTLEEANSNLKNWIRQRSRWVKGYMQTYLVHTRSMLPFIREKGLQAFMLHLVIGGRIAFIFINPILWGITISYFLFHGVFDTIVQNSFPPFVLYIAVASLVLGNYLYLLAYILGCVKRNQWGLIKYIYLLPIYLLLISVAGCIALYQLLFKPYYWEKTIHGLHLQPKTPSRVRGRKQHAIPLPTVLPA